MEDEEEEFQRITRVHVIISTWAYWDFQNFLLNMSSAVRHKVMMLV